MAVLIVFLFFIMGEFWVQATTQGLIYSLIFLSITIITGIGGMVSLAQAAFVSGGALFAGMLISALRDSVVPRPVVCGGGLRALRGVGRPFLAAPQRDRVWPFPPWRSPSSAATCSFS